jgi:hypothetical protein
MTQQEQEQMIQQAVEDLLKRGCHPGLILQTGNGLLTPSSRVPFQTLNIPPNR